MLKVTRKLIKGPLSKGELLSSGAYISNRNWAIEKDLAECKYTEDVNVKPDIKQLVEGIDEGKEVFDSTLSYQGARLYCDAENEPVCWVHDLYAKAFADFHFYGTDEFSPIRLVHEGRTVGALMPYRAPDFPQKILTSIA